MDELRSEGGVVRIPLHSRKHPGFFAIVDEADADLVNQYRWNPAMGHTTIYAVCCDGVTTIQMHRLITGAQGSIKVDHIDHDGLNNRRDNLRTCSNSENMRNRSGLNKKNTTGFVGVYVECSGRFSARISIHGKQRLVGVFASAEAAARARDAAARQHYGAFATFNFPRAGEKGVKP